MFAEAVKFIEAIIIKELQKKCAAKKDGPIK
jgi:hypothetical protein